MLSNTEKTAERKTRKLTKLNDEQEKVFRLRCAHQTFTWGKLGEDSLVAELLKGTDSTLKIEPETPYSELWMGTHCLGSSRIIRSDGSEEDLDKWISTNPGAVSLQNGRGSLSFMFKVLSIRKTLSLQIHPDKKMAKIIHEENPDVYKDPNHKPEMAIAINNFRALVGFKPIQTISRHIEEVEELAEIVGLQNAKELKEAALATDKNRHHEALKKCFEEVFVNENIRKYALLKQLISRVRTKSKAGEDVSVFESPNLLKIAEEYPDDIGVMAVFFLNEITLKAGQALFIDVNKPHAYLEGDCLECLTNSHNIVRFGLTHKLKDFDNLVQMLKYESTASEKILVLQTSYEKDDVNYTHFLPPTEEFAVTKIEILADVISTINSLNVASMVLCFTGKARVSNRSLKREITIERGTAMFVSAGETIRISKQSDTVILYRAYAP